MDMCVLSDVPLLLIVKKRRALLLMEAVDVEIRV